MRPDLCHRLSHLFVLFEFGTVPESRVDRGSRGWGGLFGGGVSGRVWFAETSGCLVSGLVSRQSNG